MGWAYDTTGERRGAYLDLVGRPEGKKHLDDLVVDVILLK
jgi:hypothetical protein